MAVAELEMLAELVMLVVVVQLLTLAAHRPETAFSMAVSDVQSRASLAAVTVADVQPLLQAAVANYADRTRFRNRRE